MTDTILNDDTKIQVQSLVPVVCYSCPVTFEYFSWLEIGDTQEMTYKQIRSKQQFKITTAQITFKESLQFQPLQHIII